MAGSSLFRTEGFDDPTIVDRALLAGREHAAQFGPHLAKIRHLGIDLPKMACRDFIDGSARTGPVVGEG